MLAYAYPKCKETSGKAVARKGPGPARRSPPTRPPSAAPGLAAGPGRAWAHGFCMYFDMYKCIPAHQDYARTSPFVGDLTNGVRKPLEIP